MNYEYKISIEELRKYLHYMKLVDLFNQIFELESIVSTADNKYSLLYLKEELKKQYAECEEDYRNTYKIEGNLLAPDYTIVPVDFDLEELTEIINEADDKQAGKTVQNQEQYSRNNEKIIMEPKTIQKPKTIYLKRENIC